jgi:hypothetical protein
MLNPIEKGFRNVLSYMQQHWREVRLHCLPVRAAPWRFRSHHCVPRRRRRGRRSSVRTQCSSEASHR